MRRVKVESPLPPHPESLNNSLKVSSQPIGLSEDIRHYLLNVLRMQLHEHVELFDGTGVAWEARISSLSPFEVSLLHPQKRNTESNVTLRIYQAIPKGDRWDWFLEKATELGVDEIIPIYTSRSVVTIPPKKIESKLLRWSKIVDGAARQSGRLYSPEIFSPSPLKEALKGLPSSYTSFVANPYATPVEKIAPSNSIAFWIGPEGGFSDEEVSELREAGVVEVSFGPRILRSETAGVFAAAKAQILWGDM